MLCLACSSSLPSSKGTSIFTTACCVRPICPTCIEANPRLARYNPCLQCLGGIDVVARNIAAQKLNVDGAVRDEDNFVVGDDEEDENEVEEVQQPEQTVAPTPSDKYYLKRGDTLQGIALRFKVDGRQLCALNNLPPSTLSTTPHLLHTRGFLILPPSAHSQLNPSDTHPSSAEERAREVRRIRERAEKKLQTLTKQTDWRIAKAYIALADDPDSVDAFQMKQKELGGSAAGANLEAVAVDQYLDDDEWEAEQLRAGRSMHIQPLALKS
ncbi:LysM domain-containing protein [Mycena kentingensis (nom. inval.)]|nr:LysM domain-containing protein [Mycena kentingensis (nom. inval.)]